MARPGQARPDETKLCCLKRPNQQIGQQSEQTYLLSLSSSVECRAACTCLKAAATLLLLIDWTWDQLTKQLPDKSDGVHMVDWVTMKLLHRLLGHSHLCSLICLLCTAWVSCLSAPMRSTALICLIAHSSNWLPDFIHPSSSLSMFNWSC